MMKSRKVTKMALALATLSVMTGGPAFAETAKQTGDSGVEEQLRFKAGDETGNEIKALKTELLVIKSEKQALDQLNKLLRKYKGTRMEPELLFRQAELFMRRARTERFFEVHRNSEQVATFAPQLVKAASEAGEIRKAISIYDQLQKRFPNFRSMDLVIFNTAYARQQLGEDKLAEASYLRLIKEFPDSELVPDAYLSVGEINYQRRNFSMALDHFRAIRKYPHARAYPYGLYKAAWTYYNLQDAASGMKQLEEVIKYGHEMAKTRIDAKLDLRKEALGDLALFYGDVMQPGNAVDYFRKHARDIDSSPYVLRLVEIYKRHSRLNDIEVVLKDFLAKMPESEMIATAHEELIWNYERLKARPKAVAQLEAFDKVCEKLTSKSSKEKTEAARTLVAQCHAKVADASKKLATKWHSAWKKGYGQKEGEELSASAEKAYRLYLKSPDSKDEDLAAVRYSFAELLFARGLFREASATYAAIEGDQKLNPKLDAKVAHDAAYASIVSLEKAVGDKWSDADEKQFIALSESYLKRFPQAQYGLDLKFKRAFIAYEKERYDEASAQFKKIGWSETRGAGGVLPEKVLKAQDLYLDILNIKKDYRGLKEAAQSLLTGGSQSARTTQIEKIYREAYFSEIQQLEEKKDFAAAIDAYKKFAQENKSSELAPKAWWNASQLQFKTGNAMGGADTCQEMYKLFPKVANSRDCLNRAASTYEAMGQLDLAAKVVSDLAEIEPEQADKWKELAADFYALSGSRDRAFAQYLKLADDKKAGKKQSQLLEKAAFLALDMGDMKAHQSIENKFAQMGIEPQTSRMQLEQAEEALAKSDLTKAFNISKKLIGRDGLPKDILARARFVQAQVLEDEYRKQSVKAKVERLGLVLAIKTEKLEKSQQAYQSAIKYGDPQTSVKAFRRLADCYIDYARTVRGLTPPGGSAAEQEAFKAEIEQLAIPLEEKGIEAMNQGLEVAKKAQLRDGQIADLQNEVNKLNMKESAVVPTTVVQPSVYVPAFVRAPASSEVGL